MFLNFKLFKLPKSRKIQIPCVSLKRILQSLFIFYSLLNTIPSTFHEGNNLDSDSVSNLQFILNCQDLSRTISTFLNQLLQFIFSQIRVQSNTKSQISLPLATFQGLTQTLWAIHKCSKMGNEPVVKVEASQQIQIVST